MDMLRSLKVFFGKISYLFGQGFVSLVWYKDSFY